MSSKFEVGDRVVVIATGEKWVVYDQSEIIQGEFLFIKKSKKKYCFTYFVPALAHHTELEYEIVFDSPLYQALK